MSGTSRWTGILASILLLNGLGASASSQLERVDPGTQVPSITVEELARAVEEGKPAPVEPALHLHAPSLR